ncbi:protein-ADP-ribose hydrolase [Paenibacillus sp. HW567]|uniref:protein-ADP-ribose hydrolase n=1 Tax=Paenibacillus sp. HW567 TaxID=1034769 RepID=UPI0003A9C204|nr:protein-ADP-ribose hydrolase [Paenibacillus sp. HW567]
MMVHEAPNLELDAYRTKIRLDQPHPAIAAGRLTEQQYLESLEAAAKLLLEDPEGYMEGIPSASPDQKRAYIKAALTIKTPGAANAKLNPYMDVILQYERQFKTITKASALTPLSKQFQSIQQEIAPEIYLWQGDITELEADAIVNAANSRMLGCFQPFHACIDNAIHSASGPELREDCNVIMELQGHAEPTGYAKITRAYNLPSRFVLHTVGPIIAAGQAVTEHQRSLLAGCYTSCLELAAQVDSICSVAFCGISTGVFGYPKREAAVVAVNVVQAWLKQHPGRFGQIIFNVFSDEDREIYESVLEG